jgi:hypothetical protein
VILHRCLANSGALSERVLEVDRDAVLPKQIAKGFIRQFLKIRHPVARELLELVERVIVKGDQFAHDRPASCIASMRFNPPRRKSFRPRTGPKAAQDSRFEPGRMLNVSDAKFRSPQNTRPSAQYDADGLAETGHQIGSRHPVNGILRQVMKSKCDPSHFGV